MKVVIVGGVAGGASAAARLRRLNEEAEIVIFEKGEYISYANCGLPYYIGGEITNKSSLTLHTPESFREGYNLDVRIKQEVIGINPEEKTVTVKRLSDEGRYDEPYDYLILSPGAAPIVPELSGMDDERIFTLRTVNDAYKISDFIRDRLVKKAVVIGGGYIGIEMAENLSKRGISVEVVEMAPHIIAPLDVEMAAVVQNYVRSKGIVLRTNQAVQGFTQEGRNLFVEVSNRTIPADLVLMSVGVRPETDFIKNAGIEVNARGSVVVDEAMRTNIDSIYAIGDAVEITHFITGEKGFIPLAGPANKQGRIVADQICGLNHSYKNTQGTSILKIFDMVVATTGVNERMAKTMNIPYDKVYVHGASHATYYPGATTMIIKVLFNTDNGRILGAEIVGFDGVDKRIDVLATAIRAEMTASDLTELELAYAPPFSSAKDPINMAGYAIENLLLGFVEQFHWDEVDGLPRDGRVQLIDVNTPFTYYRNHIEGFQNIPLNILRGSIKVLDKDKPVYINCSTAVTSYYALRILKQQGFKTVKHLSGGLGLYSLVKRNQIEEKQMK